MFLGLSYIFYLFLHTDVSELIFNFRLLTFESRKCFYYAMKPTSGFVASSGISNTYPWWKVMLKVIWYVETKGFSISLAVSVFIFLIKRVEYPLGFKALNQTKQVTLKFRLYTNFCEIE